METVSWMHVTHPSSLWWIPHDQLLQLLLLRHFCIDGLDLELRPEINSSLFKLPLSRRYSITTTENEMKATTLYGCNSVRIGFVCPPYPLT